MTSTAFPGPTDAAIAAFQRDGAICLRAQAVDWVDRLRIACDWVRDNPGPHFIDFSRDATRGYYADVFMWLRNADIRTYVLSSPIAALAGRLMGATESRFFFDHLFVKEPGSNAPTPWHQDLPYWPIDGRQVCSVWLALDRVTAESGALSYVRGSHRPGQLYALRRFTQLDVRKQADLPEMPDIDADRGRYELLSWDLEPGDVIVHDARTIHGAPGNTTSDRRRRGFATRWLGEDVRYHPRADVPELFPAMLALHAPGLAPGDRLARDLFPLVWSL